jgi:hypothetical protein
MGKKRLPLDQKVCFICPSTKFVDDHHVDCCEGKLSPETVPLCRRCHRTYHDLGVDYFDDEYLDKAIELENRRREIYNANLEYFKKVRAARTAQSPWNPMLKKPITPLPLLKREDIKRSDYFNKKHGLPKTQETKGSRTPAFNNFHLPHGEPLCGWPWVYEHKYDLLDWVPRIEIITPDLHLAVDINSKKKLRDVVKAIRGLK